MRKRLSEKTEKTIVMEIDPASLDIPEIMKETLEKTVFRIFITLYYI
jgi:hypothetical protein